MFGPDTVTYDRYVDTILDGLYATTDWAPLAELAAGLYDFTFNSANSGRPGCRSGRRGALSTTTTGGGHRDRVLRGGEPARPVGLAPSRRSTGGQRRPFFAADWAGRSEFCVTWPATDEDRYQGPFNRVTSAPVLLIQNRHDPATPYHGALAVDAELPRSRLLTLNGNGHTTWLNKSRCIDRYREGYLVRVRCLRWSDVPAGPPALQRRCCVDRERADSVAPACSAMRVG